MGVYQKCLGCGVRQKTWSGYCEPCAVDAALAAQDQRIAELESRVQQLEAERVPTEILKRVVDNFGFSGVSVIADIIELRQKNREEAGNES